MALKQELTKLKQLLQDAQSVTVTLSADTGYDQIAAGLGLYFGLLKQGKQVSVASSGRTSKFENLIGSDKIKDCLSNKNMVISLPYEEGSIDKVSYNFDARRLNLVIEPTQGPLKFSRDQVTFSSGGFESDLIVTIGAQKIQALGDIYKQNKDTFEKTKIINIDNNANNSSFGTVNIVNSKLPTVSEIAVLVLKNLGVKMDETIATNLYRGLWVGTQKFSPDNVSALTFEAAAFCLRHGASKLKKQPKKAKKQKEAVQEEAPTDWLKPKIFSEKSQQNKQ